MSAATVRRLSAMVEAEELHRTGLSVTEVAVRMGRSARDVSGLLRLADWVLGRSAVVGVWSEQSDDEHGNGPR